MGHPAWQDVWGSQLIAVTIRAMLLGVLSVQINTYFRKSRKDPLLIKLWVLLALAVDLSGVGIHAAVVFKYLGHHWGDLPRLATRDPLTANFSFNEGIAGLVTQLYFIRRFYLLNPRYWPLALAVLLLALLSCASCLSYGSLSIVVHSLNTELKKQAAWRLYLWFIGSAVVDVLVALPVIYFLHKNRTGFKGTDTLINKMIVWVVGTGAFTAVLSIILIIIYVSANTSQIATALCTILSSIYSNGLLAFLNRRAIWGQERESNKGIDIDQLSDSFMLKSIRIRFYPGRGTTQDTSAAESSRSDSAADEERRGGVLRPHFHGLDRDAGRTRGTMGSEETRSTAVIV